LHSWDNELFGALLVRATQDKLKLLGGDADCLEDCRYAELVVLCSVVDKLDRSLEVVKKAVTEICQT